MSRDTWVRIGRSVAWSALIAALIAGVILFSAGGSSFIYIGF